MKALELFKSQVLSPALLAKASSVPDGPAAKVDHVASMITAINKEAKAINMQEAELAAKRKALEQLVESAEEAIIKEMTEQKIEVLKGTLIQYTVPLCPHKLIIDNPSLIPKDYIRETIVLEIRKDALKDDLKLGALVAGAHLEQGITLKLSAIKE